MARVAFSVVNPFLHPGAYCFYDCRNTDPWYARAIGSYRVVTFQHANVKSEPTASLRLFSQLQSLRPS
jgi:hypothetical protein